MKSNIQDLKRQLIEAELLEKNKELHVELEKAKELYFNKCYASHTLTGKFPDKEFNAVWYKDIYIENDKIRFKSINISARRNTDGVIQFQINNLSYGDPRSGYSGLYRYEISKEQFITAKKQASATIDNLFNSLTESFKNPKELLNGYEYDECKLHTKYLHENNVPIIDLSSNKEILDILRWNYHPFVFSGKWLLNNQASRQIIIKIADKLHDSAVSWGGKIYERDMPRSKTLMSFINDTNWL